MAAPHQWPWQSCRTARQRQVGLQGKMDEVPQEFDPDEEILTHVLQLVGTESAIVKKAKPEKKAETWGLPGFLGKARVTTSFGELPIEALRRRDQLRTITGDYLPVAWIDRVKLDRDFLRHHPNARPVEIPAGILGNGTPKTEIWVSRQQKVQYSCFKQETTTVRLLLQRNGILPRMNDHATYYLFHCGKPAMVCVEGLWCLTEPQNYGA